jgi:hypothetical protein
MKKRESHNPLSEFDGRELNLRGLRARSIEALEELKQRLLQETASAGPDPATLPGLRRAAEEAASLAWATPFPLLVLPELFSEKAAEACIRSQRQRDIRQRSRRLTDS